MREARRGHIRAGQEIYKLDETIEMLFGRSTMTTLLLMRWLVVDFRDTVIDVVRVDIVELRPRAAKFDELPESSAMQRARRHHSKKNQRMAGLEGEKGLMVN